MQNNPNSNDSYQNTLFFRLFDLHTCLTRLVMIRGNALEHLIYDMFGQYSWTVTNNREQITKQNLSFVCDWFDSKFIGNGKEMTKLLSFYYYRIISFHWIKIPTYFLPFIVVEVFHQTASISQLVGFFRYLIYSLCRREPRWLRQGFVNDLRAVIPPKYPNPHSREALLAYYLFNNILRLLDDETIRILAIIRLNAIRNLVRQQICSTWEQSRGFGTELSISV